MSEEPRFAGTLRKNLTDPRTRVHEVVLSDVPGVVPGPGAGPARGHRLRRSGLANAVLVPNTYERPERAVGHIEAGDPAVVLFQATFDYAPHMDAVDWSVAEVAPRLRARVPDLGIRLVGKPVPGWSTSTGHQL